jgi:hypothetical protein
MNIEIITPETKRDMWSDGLRALTRALYESGKEGPIGCLGGNDGYGVDFENETFAMFPFYWGDCTCGFDEREYAWAEAHVHGPECYRNKVAADLRELGWTTADCARHDQSYVEAPKGMEYSAYTKQQDAVREKWCKRLGLTFPDGCAVHCTCGHDAEYEAWEKVNGHTDACLFNRPNFLHKPTGLRVNWYKWIGRDTEVKGEGDPLQIIQECIASLKPAH